MIYYHADDYGITRQQDETILSCYQKGKLNSISILPNTLHLQEGLQVLNEVDPKREIRRVLHLNFVEGKCLSDPKEVDMLVDSEGYFCRSFIDIWKWNFILHGKKRKKLYQQLKTELTAQFQEVTQKFDFDISAVDSHQHYHMIPIVYDTLIEVIKDAYSDKISEIRVPADPLGPIVTTPSLWKRVRAVNLVKWCILKPFGVRNRKRIEQMGKGYPVFFGMIFTCEMKKEYVSKLLPKYEKIAKHKGKKLELMFHPGNLSEEKDLLDPKSEELRDFYFSPLRIAEKTCLQEIGAEL